MIDSLQALRRSRGGWDALHARDPASHIFASWDWVFAWFERLDCQWLVLAVRSPGTEGYAGLLPLQLYTERRRDGRLYNELSLVTGVAGYAGLICHPAHEEAAARALGEAVRRLRWSKLRLENFHAPPRRLRAFMGGFATSRYTTVKFERPDDGDGVDHDVYVYVDLPGDWDAYLSRKMGYSTRNNARRILRAIDSGELAVTCATPATLKRDLSILLGFWEKQWAAKLAARYNARLPVGMMSNFRGALHTACAAGTLYLPVLWQGEQPIGAQGKLIDAKNRSLIGLLGGRDLSVRKPAPGFALHVHSLRWAVQNGFTTYDMQTGDFAYKYDFGAEEQKVECFEVTPRVPQERLEPASLPAALRWADAERNAGRLADAERICRQVLEADPAHAPALNLLARIDAQRAPAEPAVNLAAQLKSAGGLTLEEQIRRALGTPKR